MNKRKDMITLKVSMLVWKGLEFVVYGVLTICVVTALICLIIYEEALPWTKKMKKIFLQM